MRIWIPALISVGMMGGAQAADLSSKDYPESIEAQFANPAWNVAYGVKFASDYISRGATQTRGNFAIQGYSELQLFNWFYINAWASNVDYGRNSSDPTAEIDLSFGLRHTWNRLTLDLAYVAYYYPGERDVNSLGKGVPDHESSNSWEIVFTPRYAVNDILTVGSNVRWTTDFDGTGADATYLTGTAKLNLSKWSPVHDIGFYLSGEYGRQFRGTTDLGNPQQKDYKLGSFDLWNVGGGFTYKSTTIDLRYWDSSIESSSRGERFVASVAFDTTLNPPPLK
ncbi:TorF family putative porin [Rhodomicrobium lacus]|uniref:TorF family putative porin n=1 Tax=Rhodomicrobium lacus TaxID=2498452 RepID=UPI0026E2937E|nr:TorF family putative porin [Rhodomicrobium lacus]WKW51280.1 TorF family putative porin [Rhodomicrobium lacus]